MEPTDTPEQTENSANDDKIAWHPAFFEAIQMELDEYSHALQFISEYQLTTEPLRIDVVIIKKTSDVPIKKNIAAIFRRVNILEYKSPDDHISVKDFYLVYGYACLYLNLNNIKVSELTLTFVESHYPRKLIDHLAKERRFTVEESGPGIYSVKGDVFPIQIIDSRRLSVDENIWLKELDNRLDAPQIRRITTEIVRLGKDARIKAYLDVIMRANRQSLQEAFKMSGTALPTLDEVLEEIGVTARWEAKAEERKALEIAANMLRNGFPVEQVAALSGLDIEKIRTVTGT